MAQQPFQGEADQLIAEDVLIRFGGIAAVDGVSLALRRGEILGLIGPNGAGKTTLVNLLTGFLRCARGRLRLNPGSDITHWGPERIARAGVARTFQGVRLFKSFTVAQNLEASAIGSGLSLRAARDCAHQVLQWLDLEWAAPLLADTLPYGDERRVGIARALAMRPRFLLLDEPAAGLNDAECDALMHTISRIPVAFGCGILLIEHNMRVIMGVCHRIHVMDFGRTIAEGEPVEIRCHPEVIRAYLGPQV